MHQELHVLSAKSSDLVASRFAARKAKHTLHAIAAVDAQIIAVELADELCLPCRFLCGHEQKLHKVEVGGEAGR